LSERDYKKSQLWSVAMAAASEIVKHFYAAAVMRDLAKARSYLADDLVFVGLFQTYHGADDFMTAFTGLLQVTIRLEVKTIIAQGDEAAVFFELETRAPAEGIVLVAEWHQIKKDKIAHVESAFDGRPFAAMFASGRP
jgi:ketosteroid isomerase-like protein